MLKHITVPIIVDDHDESKCSYTCKYYRYVGYIPVCVLCNNAEITNGRCKQCIKEAK